MYCQYKQNDFWPDKAPMDNKCQSSNTVFGTTEGRVYFQADESAQILINICKNVAQPLLLLSEI